MGRWGFLGSSARFEILPFYGFTLVEPFALRLFLVVFFALPVAGLAVLAAYRAVREPSAVHGWLLLANCLFIVFLTRISVADVLAFFRLMTV